MTDDAGPADEIARAEGASERILAPSLQYWGEIDVVPIGDWRGQSSAFTIANPALGNHCEKPRFLARARKAREARSRQEAHHGRVIAVGLANSSRV
jgi:hypothetical protein